MVVDFSKTNSIISDWISEVRDYSLQKDSLRFRRNIERIGEIAAYEISKTLSYIPANIKTPLGIAACAVLKKQPVLATILRAGLPLHQGILNVFDKAHSAFVGSYHKFDVDNTFVVNQQYMTSPKIENETLILADPMLGTGATIATALEALTENEKPASIHIVSVVACKIGIEFILDQFPEANLWCGAIDNELTSNGGYILPGLGDAGDLAFGKKQQH